MRLNGAFSCLLFVCRAIYAPLQTKVIFSDLALKTRIINNDKDI